MSDTITIRDVPNDAHDELMARADLYGQSLQEYVRTELDTLAGKPDMKELMARLREWKAQAGINVPIERILAELHAERR